MKTIEQMSALAKEFQSHAKVPDYAFKVIDSLPETVHPMTQFTYGIIALQVHQSSTSYRSVRWFQVQSAPQEDLRAQLQKIIPERQERLKKLKSECRKVSVRDVAVDMVIGAMREIKGMIWDTSLFKRQPSIIILAHQAIKYAIIQDTS
jgi:hypothetical protein